MSRKLETYDKIVELARRENELQNKGNASFVGVYKDEAIKRMMITKTVKKYVNNLSPEELNILELNLSILDNVGFLTSLNNTARNLYNADSFLELLRENDAKKMNVVINKMCEYFLFPRDVIIRKIKEVLTYTNEIKKGKIR